MKSKPNRPASVSFCSYPALVYVWPVIVVGYIFWLIAYFLGLRRLCRRPKGGSMCPPL